MKLPPFFKPAESSKEINAPILVADFGTSELRAAVCRKEEEKIKVLSLVKIPYPSEIIYFGRIINIRKAEEVTKAAFQEVTTSLAKEDYPQGVIFFLWGEVLRVQTTTGKLALSAEEKSIKKNKKNELLQKLSEVALIEVSQQWVSQTGRDDLEIEEQESFITKIRADGQDYQSLEDLGVVQELEINQTAIYIDKEQQEILNKLAKTVKLPIINLIFGPQALLQLQEKLNSPLAEAVILDIDGRTTNISLIFENNLWTSRVLGLGGDDFISFLALNLDLSFEEALQKILNFVNNDLSEEERVKINGFFGEVLEIWCQGLELALSEIEGVRVYPKLFLLGGGGILFPKIKKFLEAHSWSRSLAFTEEPKFELLNLDKVGDLFDFGNVEYDKVRDFWLFISALSQNSR